MNTEHILTPAETDIHSMVDKGWRSACKVVFGEDIGALSDYEDYLKEAVVGREVGSSFSGKKLWVTSPHHPKGSRFFDFSSEREKLDLELSKPLDIDKIKDIDSLLEGVRERLVYCGSKALGNSAYVEDSDAVIDSSVIVNSSIVNGSKNLAYTYQTQFSERSYGCTASGQSSNLIRCFYNNSLNRCFEICASVGTSDSLFCYNVWNSSGCMFSFNLRSKRNMIANIQLAKEQYDSLKAKLLGEVVSELKARKRLDLSIIDIMNRVRK